MFEESSLVWRFRCLYAMSRARAASTRTVKGSTTRRLLVVCYGNIYRSPLVGMYLDRELQGRVDIRSAGLHPSSGRPSPPRHVGMCLEYGIDLSAHRSAVVTAKDFSWADLIVIMDRHNWQSARQLGAPSQQIVWLGAFSAGPVEIADPFNMADTAARQTVDRLVECSRQLAAALEATR